MTNTNVKEILELLDIHYKHEDKCYLNFEPEKPWQLLIATILSAQCTDERVNTVTKDLFKKYPELIDFAEADFSEMERDIHSTGFYHNKAKSIILTSRQLLEKYAGELPNDINELTNLQGVGRKTANVVRGHIFNIPSIVVDTHVKRISMKLGFTKNSTPEKIEFDLMEALPKEHWIRYNQQVIAHGRKICKARKADCDMCFLSPYCPSVTLDK